MIEVYFDGAWIQKEHTGGWAFTIYNDQTKKYHRQSGTFKDCSGSCNVAEYYGLLQALKYLLTNNLNNEQIRIKGDSLMVINQQDKIGTALITIPTTPRKKLLKNVHKLYYKQSQKSYKQLNHLDAPVYPITNPTPTLIDKYRYRIKKGLYRPYALEARELIKSLFPNISFKWVPREHNSTTDDMTKRELLNIGIDSALLSSPS